MGERVAFTGPPPVEVPILVNIKGSSNKENVPMVDKNMQKNIIGFTKGIVM